MTSPLAHKFKKPRINHFSLTLPKNRLFYLGGIILFFIIFFLVFSRLPVIKRARLNIINPLESPVQILGSGCFYLPSSLFGAPASEWQKYKCVNGTAVLKTADSSPLLQGQAASGSQGCNNDLCLEKFNLPSVSGFGSSTYTGEATVSYPLELAPAAAGFSPDLSLLYSSGAVEDMRIGLVEGKGKPEGGTVEEWRDNFKQQGSNLGLGWSLSGTPQIVKNSKGKYFLTLNGRSFELVFDSARTPNYDSSHPEAYDGQAACRKAVYRTEPESYLKIVRPEIPCGSGYGKIISWSAFWDSRPWEIGDKNGNSYRFEPLGYTIVREYFQENCPGTPWKKFKNRGNYYKWPIVRNTVPSGNRIVYEYDTAEMKGVEAGCGGCGDCSTKAELPYQDGLVKYPKAIYLKKIKYGKDLSAKVELTYTSREDTKIEKASDTYVVNFFTDKLLNKIDVYYGINLLRTYKLNYQYLFSPGQWGEGETHGRLFLTGIQLLGAGIHQTNQTISQETYPVNSSFEYYPRESDSRFLLYRARNGYGATTEYQYENDFINPSISINDEYFYSGKYQKRNRLREKKIIGTNPSSQVIRTVYEYPSVGGNNPGVSCPGLTGNQQCPLPSGSTELECYNAHATTSDEFLTDFEFLGYHYVKERVFTKEGSSPEKEQPLTYYSYHQGQEYYGYSNSLQACVYHFKPDPNKGALIKKILTSSEGSSLSIEENDYIVDSNRNNFNYLSQSRSCSDLDITTLSLRRGSKSEFQYTDTYGNQTASKEYEASSCDLNRTDSFVWNWSINNLSSSLYRQTNTVYAYLNPSADDNRYIVDRPVESVLTDSAGSPKKKTLFYYDYQRSSHNPINRGLLTDTAEINTANRQTINQRFEYDAFGNQVKNISYADYGLATPDLRNIQNWPTDARTNEVTFPVGGSYFGAFPTLYKNAFGQYEKEVSYGNAFAALPQGDYYYSGDNRPYYRIFQPSSVKHLDQTVSNAIYDSFGRTKKFLKYSQFASDFPNHPTAEYTYFINDVSRRAPLVVKLAKKETNEGVGVLVNPPPNDGNRLVSYSFYDDWGRLIETQEEGSSIGKVIVQRTFYDPLGWVIKKSVPKEINANLGVFTENADLATTTDYDSLGRTLRTVNPDGTCSLTKYEGKKTSVYNEEANLTTGETDNFGRAKKTTVYTKSGSSANNCSGAVSYPSNNYSPYSISENLEINILDQVTRSAVKNPAGQVLSQATTEYDGFGRIISSNDPDLGTTRISEYDAVGNIKAKTDNANQIISFDYDVLNRLVAKYWGEGASRVLKASWQYENGLQWPYNPVYRGKLVKETMPGVLVKTYDYEDNEDKETTGRLKAVTTEYLGNFNGPKKIIKEYTYHPLNDRIKSGGLKIYGLSNVEIWNELLTSVYDASGRQQSLVSDKGVSYLTNLSYRPYGQLAGQTLANGTQETFQYYDSAAPGKTLRLQSHQAINNLLSLEYPNYDKLGNIKEKTDRITSQTYSYNYDDLSRLISVAGPYRTSYQYDELNRLTVKNEGVNLTFGFNNSFPLNAPKSINGDSSLLSYNLQTGNLENNRGKTLIYDRENRLTEIREGANVLEQNEYDNNGQRIKKTAGSKTTLYLEGLEIIKDSAGSNTTTVKVSYPGNALRVLTFNGNTLASNQLHNLYADDLSSTKAIADGSGRKTAGIIDYYPYGTKKEGEIANLPTDRLYTGQRYEGGETGLYYYNARFYDPYLGVFTSPDKAQGGNRFGYVSGNPINKNDPTGQTVVLPESLKKFFQIPDFPKPPMSPTENIGYTLLAYTNNLLKSVEALSELRLLGMSPIPKDPLVEKFRTNLEANPKYQWANFDIKMAQGLAMFSTLQVPTEIAGIPIGSVRDTLRAMRGIVQHSNEVTNEMPNQLLSLAEEPVTKNLEPLQKYFSTIMEGGSRGVKAELPQAMKLLNPENLNSTLTVMNAAPVNPQEVTISKFFNWLISAQGWNR